MDEDEDDVGRADEATMAAAGDDISILIMRTPADPIAAVARSRSSRSNE
jgi:hypothetical protein